MKHDDVDITEWIIIIAGSIVGVCGKIYSITHDYTDNGTLSNIYLGFIVLLLVYKIFRKLRSRFEKTPDQDTPESDDTD